MAVLENGGTGTENAGTGKCQCWNLPILENADTRKCRY